MLAHIDDLEEAWGRVSQPMEEPIGPLAESKRHRMTIPGWPDRTAEAVRAEIGVDRQAFPSDQPLGSGSGLCLGNRRSAGKPQPEKIRQGDRWPRAALVQAAWAAVGENKPNWSAQYHRWVAHRGKPKAIVAVAHCMLVIAYHWLANSS